MIGPLVLLAGMAWVATPFVFSRHFGVGRAFLWYGSPLFAVIIAKEFCK